jgi:hypothetical protein
VIDAYYLASVAPDRVVIDVRASAVAPAGLAASNDSPGLLGAVTLFTATTGAGTGLGYRWNFGDGSAALNTSVPYAQHAYGRTGVYTASVTASNSLASASASTVATIAERSIAGLQVTGNAPTLAGNYTTFGAQVTAGSNVVYRWDFGDGSPVLAGNPVVRRYLYAGNYSVAVTASNNLNEITASMPVIVFAAVAEPTAVTLDHDGINEYEPTGSVVGRLGAINLVSETYTFALVSGAGGDDNASFAVAGNELHTQAVFVYNARNRYSMRVRATNSYTLSRAAAVTVLAQMPVTSVATLPDMATTFESVPIVIDALGNDTGGALTLDRVSAPLSGTVAIAGDRIVYTPTLYKPGVDRFGYVARSGADLASGQIMVTVQAVDRPPQAVDDSFELERDTALTLTVLANDAAFLPTDTLRVANYSLPQWGALDLRPDRALIYRPFALYSGVDQFAYSVQDQTGLQSTA